MAWAGSLKGLPGIMNTVLAKTGDRNMLAAVARSLAAGMLAVTIMAVSSCDQRYAADPEDEFGDAADLSYREEVREVRGEFWCSEYGDYFAPDDLNEIWCTFGGGLCTRYWDEVDRALEDEQLEYGDLYVEMRLSGFIGSWIDEYYELDCSRTFHVTSIDRLRVRSRRVRYEDDQ
jgi:hypothetical protein